MSRVIVVSKQPMVSVWAQRQFDQPVEYFRRLPLKQLSSLKAGDIVIARLSNEDIAWLTARDIVVRRVQFIMPFGINPWSRLSLAEFLQTQPYFIDAHQNSVA